MPDEQLVRSYRRGDQQAFSQLIERYQQELYRFLVRFVRDRAAAEDVFQDTFLQVHVSIDTFQTSKRFKPWLFTIAANKARDYLRRSKRRAATQLSSPVQPGSDEDRDRQFLDLLEANLPLPDDETAQQETADLVRAVVDGLPEHLREILLLAYFHQFSYKQVAEVLHIPLGTVKSRLHAAVGTFAQRWKQKLEQSN